MESNMIADNQALIDLLRQLAEVQKQITTIISTRFERQTEENVKSNVNVKNDFINEQAKRYGQDPSIAQPALDEFSDSLENVRREYSNEKNLWLQQGSEFEQDEFDRVEETRNLQNKLQSLKREYKEQKRQEELKNEIEKYKSYISSNKEKINNSRQCSKHTRENIKDCSSRCNTKINEIAEDKSIAKNDNKKSIFKELFAKIKDKIGGKEKFMQNVVEPIKGKAKYIKDEIVPKVKDEIKENVLPKLKDLFERGKEKIQELNLPEKFSKLMEYAKEGAKVIAEKASSFKDIAIAGISKGVEVAKQIGEKVSEKIADVVENVTER